MEEFKREKKKKRKHEGNKKKKKSGVLTKIHHFSTTKEGQAQDYIKR